MSIADEQLRIGNHSLCTWLCTAEFYPNKTRARWTNRVRARLIAPLLQTRSAGDSRLGPFRAAMGRRNRRVDAATDVEVADHGHRFGPDRQDEVVQDSIDHGFVECAFVAVPPKIKL